MIESIEDQERAVQDLMRIFPTAKLVDRRKTPSHGYRAIHMLPKIDGFVVEIQVRTRLQHLWAELSEKLSDILDKELKYGGGPNRPRDALAGISRAVGMIEETELEMFAIEQAIKSDQSGRDDVVAIKERTTALKNRLRENRLKLAEALATTYRDLQDKPPSGRSKA